MKFSVSLVATQRSATWEVTISVILISFLPSFTFIIQYFFTYAGTSSSVSFDTIPQASLEDMMGGQVTVLPSYDETALCSGAFRVLRSMVSAWLRDVSLYKNVFADFQILHFYRFLAIFISTDHSSTSPKYHGQIMPSK